MKKTLSYIHEHLLKHQHKFLGLAVLCKITLLLFLAIPILQTIENTYALGHTITASTDTNGTITPVGLVDVTDGENQSFVIATNPGYLLSDLIVDSVSLNGKYSYDLNGDVVYTFLSVTKDHTITAYFAATEVAPSMMGYEVVCPTATKPSMLLNITFSSKTIDSISPAANIFIDTDTSPLGIYTDGTTAQLEVTLPLTLTDGEHTINIKTGTAINTITSTEEMILPFSLNCSAATKSFTIISSAGKNGTIDPTGPTSVEEAASQAYLIKPNDGYDIDTLTIDGKAIENTTSYTFSNVTTEHTIDVTFKLVDATKTTYYDILSNAGENGTINPTGLTSIKEAANQEYLITPDDGYDIDTLIVDGETIRSTTIYLFTKVAKTHSIHVTFKVLPITTETAAAGGGGSIRYIDNCSLGSKLLGANAKGIDYSPSSYDKECRSSEEIKCINDFGCFNIQSKVNMLSKLNESFVLQLKNIFWKDVTTATTATTSTAATTTPTESATIIPFLNGMANGMINSLKSIKIFNPVTKKTVKPATNDVIKPAITPATKAVIKKSIP
ncbi:MAG: hypothetical protein NTY80_03630 [candidate division SR1 bacterium]|nr:hypothetical protein [candidate division SR1 bacterium]